MDFSVELRNLFYFLFAFYMYLVIRTSRFFGSLIHNTAHLFAFLFFILTLLFLTSIVTLINSHGGSIDPSDGSFVGREAIFLSSDYFFLILILLVATLFTSFLTIYLFSFPFSSLSGPSFGSPEVFFGYYSLVVVVYSFFGSIFLAFFISSSVLGFYLISRRKLPDLPRPFPSFYQRCKI